MDEVQPRFGRALDEDRRRRGSRNLLVRAAVRFAAGQKNRGQAE